MDKSIFNNHNKWIKIASTFGGGDYSEDLVQETYIKCLDKEIVNEAFFYFALRNTVYDWLRKEKKQKLYLEPQQFLNENIYNYIDTWNGYDRKLYLLYIESTMSMRDIANETKISLTSIFHTIKICNERLKNYIEQHHEVQY